MGSDGQDLEFRVTVIDRAGIDSAEEFTVGVDNAAESALAGDLSGGADDDDDEADDNGGLAMGPVPIVVVILPGAVAARRRTA